MSDVMQDQELVDTDWVIEEQSSGVVTVPVTARWVMDGASTLEEAADMIRLYLGYLEGLIEDGYILVDAIENGYGLAIPADS